VVTEAERHRWDMATAAAVQVVEELEGDETTLLLATRSLCESDIPTD